MERTEYYNYTKPSQTQLNYTETSKVSAIIKRFRSTAQMGIAEGFRVTVNALDQTTIDIGPGTGYTGGKYAQNDIDGDNSGEKISTLTDSATGDVGYQNTVTRQGLADYTNGALNYVSLVYAESETIPLSSKYYPFTAYNTIVSETFTVAVLTAAQWAALTTDQLENRILVAIVTAQGAGNILSSANIQQLTQPKTHPITSASTISGVTIDSISQETIIGSGTLRFDASSKQFFWTAPGGSEGSGVTVSSSGAITLYSNNTTYWITLTVVYDSLPAANVSETITVSSLYGRTIPLSCAKDVAHRDMVGSAQPTTTNPHGLSLNDIEGGTFTHADLFHLNGISNGAESDQLECSINAVNDTVEIINNGGSINSFLIDGLTYQTIDGYSAGTVGAVAFDTTPNTATGVYLIYLDSSAAPQKVQIGEALWSANIDIVDIQNNSAGNGTITWDDGDRTLTYQAPGDGAAGAAVGAAEVFPLFTNPNGYFKLYSSNTDNWIIVRVSGALGASNNTTFSVVMNETDHPSETILKLASVHWDLPTEILSGLEDIRFFVTSDERIAFDEEHDRDGYHTKVIRNEFRLARSETCLYAQAATDYAICARANGSIGILGAAITDVGIWGIAFESTGIKGEAVSDCGVAGVATINTGVYGSAKTYGGYFTAATEQALYAEAPNTAISAIATDTAIYAYASDDVGIQAYAEDSYAVRGSAGTRAIGGFATYRTGVYGSALSAIGVYGIASVTGVYAYGTINVGLYATAPTTAISAVVANNIAIKCTAKETVVSVYAYTDTGIYARADNAAIYGVATTATGVYGIASNVGIAGSATGNNGIAVSGNANVAGGSGVVGVASLVGVGGSATSGTGVYGVCGNALGIGVYGSGNSIGVRGLAGGGNGLYGSGDVGGWVIGNNYGLYVSNTISYSVAYLAKGASVTDMPIEVNGVVYAVPLYATA